MIYHVTATFREETAAELLQKLTDGTIASQRPDGPELVASLKRAVVNGDGQIEWSELCYCPTPLRHERATVLDTHFTDIVTERIEAYQSYPGLSFLDHLRALA